LPEIAISTYPICIRCPR